MGDVAYAAALALSAVFAWAGVAKLRNRAATARTFLAFGLVAPRGLAVGVPAVELLLAAALVVVPGWAAVAALAVLAGFTTILVRALRGGTTVACGCFGTARQEPISSVELVRNGVLAAGAAVAAAADGPGWPGLDAVIAVTTAAAVAAVVLALLDLRRRTGAAFRLDLRAGP